jgi:hypothetical protein
MLIIFTSINSYAIGISGLVPYNISDAEWEQLELIEEKIDIKIEPSRNVQGCYKMTQDYLIKNHKSIAYNIQIGIFVTDEYNPSPVPNNIRFFVNGVEYKYAIIPHEIIYIESVANENKIIDRTINCIIIDANFPSESETAVQIQYSNFFDNMYGNATIMCKKNPYYDLSKYYTNWNGIPKFSLKIENYVLNNYGFENAWIGNIRFFQNIANGNIEERFLNDMLLNMNVQENNLFRINKVDANSWDMQFTKNFVEEYELAFYISIKRWGGELGSYCMMYRDELDLQTIRSEVSTISERKLAPYELIFLTNRQLRIMRNAFYARHGYMFNNEDLHNLFLKYTNFGFNYRENPDFSESMLTEIDRENIATIQRLEAMEYE